MNSADTIKLSPDVIPRVNLKVRIDSISTIKLRALPDKSVRKTDSVPSVLLPGIENKSHPAVAVPAQPSAPISAQAPAQSPATWNVDIPANPLMPVKNLRTDSVAQADSMKVSEPVYGLILEAPKPPEIKVNPAVNDGMSFIIGGLLLLFCIIGLRFRNNRKYITALFRNMVEIRLRSNVFDETVRETSFIVLLNLLWSGSAGMVLMALLIHTVPDDPASSFGIPALYSRPALSSAVCMALMVVYSCAMAVIYLTVGTVFSNLVHARMWVKGFTASQGLLGVVFFPLALLLLFYPQWSATLLYIALSTFLLAKLIFIWKGFRIFFTQFSSWVLFLYYLCSLEIVPLILTYWAACQLCSLL